MVSAPTAGFALASAQDPDGFRFVVEVLRRRAVDFAPAGDEPLDAGDRLDDVDFDPPAFDVPDAEAGVLDFAFVVLDFAFVVPAFEVPAFDEAAGFGLRDFAAVDERERLRFGLSLPIGSALPTAFTASPAAPPTVPAIFPAVRLTDLTTFPGSGIGCPPSLFGPSGDGQATHAGGVPPA